MRADRDAIDWYSKHLQTFSDHIAQIICDFVCGGKDVDRERNKIANIKEACELVRFHIEHWR